MRLKLEASDGPDCLIAELRFWSSKHLNEVKGLVKYHFRGQLRSDTCLEGRRFREDDVDVYSR